MTEQRATYHTGAPTLRPETCFKFDHPEYDPPNDSDVRALKELTGMTGGELARMVGVDARTWRAWSAPQSAERRQRIPYAAWRLLLIECGFVKNSAEYCISGERHDFAVTGRLGVASSPHLDDAQRAAEAAGNIATCRRCGHTVLDPKKIRSFSS